MRMTERTAAMIADYRGGMSRRQVAEKYGTTVRVVDNRFKDHRVRLTEEEARARMSTKKPKACDPVPADFARVAPTKSRAEIAEHYGVGKHIVARWVKESGIKGKPQVKTRPMPDDFIANAATMHANALMRHYSTGYDLIARWCNQAGVTPQAAPPSKFMRPNLGRMGKPQQAMTGSTVHTPHDDAAYVLRRFFVVHRCNDRGAYDPKGKWWRVGINVCSPDELLAKAERYRERVA